MAGINKTDTVAVKVGQKQVKEISTDGEARVVADSGIEKVDGPDLGPKAEMELFMREELEILAYEPANAGEENVIQTSVNGVNQFIIRGRPQRVKRMFVEVLARARKMHVSATGFKDYRGEAKNTVNISGGLQYPFQVMDDPNPKGSAWLRQILAEG